MTTRKRNILVALVAVIVAAVGILTITVGGDRTVTATHAVHEIAVNAEGVALDGYDPVAYFTGDKSELGSLRFEHQWKNAKWRFANASNRDAFAADPEKYAPQYGGFCAFALSVGAEPPAGSPTAWNIENGKLYLYTNKVAQILAKFLPHGTEKADKNWTTFSSHS